MADETHRCLFELEDGSFCMEAVAAQGLQCHLHTRVQEPVVAEEFRETPIRCTGRYVGGRRQGQQCTNNVYLVNVHTCGLHRNQEGQQAPAPVPVVVDDTVRTCPVRMRTGAHRGQVCGKPCTVVIGGAREEHVCGMHRTTRINQIQIVQDDYDFDAIRAVAEQNGALEHIDTLRWHMQGVPFEIYSADPAEARLAAARRALGALQRWNNAGRRWLLGLRNLLVPPRIHEGDLARLAGDAQNVHTAAANKLVAEANKELETVEAIDESLAQIKERFAERNFGTTVTRKSVYTDMKRFYSDKKIMAAVGQMETNDYGYKRLLDKVWGLIQKSKHKDDLEQRLWEEAVDSLGMCTQGHMTRLANVLQGFDEAEEAPKVEIPKGERLQTAMAQIAEMDPGERESAARRVFAELEVAEGEQGAWLEALEVA